MCMYIFGGSDDNRELEGIGDIGQALEKMRKEQYVIRDREQVEENSYQWHYKWGPRAYVE